MIKSQNFELQQNIDESHSCYCCMNMNGRGVIVIMIWTALLLLLYYYIKSVIWDSNFKTESNPESFIPNIQNNPTYEYWDNIRKITFGPKV